MASPAALRLEIYSAKLHELIVVVRKLKGEYGGESIHIKQIGTPIKHIPLNKLLAPVYSSFPEKYLSLKQDGSEKNISNNLGNRKVHNIIKTSDLLADIIPKQTADLQTIKTADLFAAIDYNAPDNQPSHVAPSTGPSHSHSEVDGFDWVIGCMMAGPSRLSLATAVIKVGMDRVHTAIPPQLNTSALVVEQPVEQASLELDPSPPPARAGPAAPSVIAAELTVLTTPAAESSTPPTTPDSNSKNLACCSRRGPSADPCCCSRTTSRIGGRVSGCTPRFC